MPECLIVCWDRQHVSAVQADTHGGTARLTGGWTGVFPENIVPAQNPRAAGEWLRGQWQAAGLTAKSVWLMMPREDVILRHLELPAIPDDELPDVVRFQTAGRSSVGLDQVHLDFLPLSPITSRPGRDVLAVTLPKTVTVTLTAVLSAAERELAGVSLSSSALAAWITAITRKRGIGDGTTMAVAFGPGRVEMAVVEDDHLNYAHAARLFDETHGDPQAITLSEISRTLVAAQRLRPEMKVDRVWLIGSNDAFAQALAERTNCPVECVDPSERLADWVVPAALKPLAADRALLFGQATLIGTKAPCAVDFIHPRQPPPKRDPRKLQYAVISACALMVVFIGAAVWVTWLAALDREIERLTQEQGRLNDMIRLGKPSLEQAAIVGAWNDRNIDQLAQIAELEKLMPGGYERPYVIDYLYQVGTTGGEILGRLNATGAAKTEQHISEFKSNISDRPYFVSLPREVKVSRDDQYPKQMVIDVQRRLARAGTKPATTGKPPAKTDKPAADKASTEKPAAPASTK